MYLQPAFLKSGDTICVLSTARKISQVEIQFALETFADWGLKVVIGKSIGAEENQFAGNDLLRKKDFQEALNNPEIKAIICAKGGYGTVRILDDLDWTGFLKSPKWICGFSDITYLHAHIGQQFGIQTLHSPMPSTFINNTLDCIQFFKKNLFGEPVSHKIEVNENNQIGEGKGILIGGNLSILYSITGTLSGFNTEGKILFLEDIDEYLYHIDRMMINLKRSGKLQGLAGLVVGGFTDIKDNAIPFGKTVENIILEHTQNLSYPICFGLQAGHIAENQTLVMGANYELAVKETEVSFCRKNNPL